MAVKANNRSGDKIINNSYNRGDVEFEATKEIKIESEYLESNLQDNYSSEDYHRKIKLDEDIYSIIFTSEEWKHCLLKKESKNNLGDLYTYILDKLSSEVLEEYTKCEIFYSAIETLDVSFEALYSSLYIIHKSELIEELNAKYNIFKKKNFNPLF